MISDSKEPGVRHDVLAVPIEFHMWKGRNIMRFMKKQRRAQRERGSNNPFMSRLQENVRRALLSGLGIVTAGAALVGTGTPA